MDVGLIGFGRAGRPVASVLLESKRANLRWVMRRSAILQHRSVPEFLGVTSEEPGFMYSVTELEAAELLDHHPVDAIIDFSSEEGMDYYVEEAAKRGIIVISAISNYPEERLERLRSLGSHTRIMHSPNITLGINFTMIAARILRNIAPEADIQLVEEHFKAKRDVSGTAKVMARSLGIPESEIISIRAGGIVGVHEVLFGFPYQTVRLKHESITREAFGNGVLFALENLRGKPNGFYVMEDLLIPYFHLKDSEEQLVAAHRTPWWQFWRH